MVPHLCRARLALRLLPGETEEGVLGRLRGCLVGLEGLSLAVQELRQRCDTGAELTLREWVPAWTCQRPELQARLLAALGTEPFAAPYTTDASAAAARGIPAYLLGPGSIEQAHTVDEWVALDQLEGAVAAYGALIQATLVPGA
jgi:acetylornithine deacetylase/succinyl-diaminopimelate desuccinylase-like protein